MHDHDRDAVNRRPGAWPTRVHPGQQNGEQREYADRQHAGGERVVLLRDRLLYEVAHGDEEQKLERAQLTQCGAPDHPGDQPKEAEQQYGAHDDFHQGTSQVWNSVVATRSLPTSTDTSPPEPNWLEG